MMTEKKNEHLIVRKPENVNELPDHELDEVIPFPVIMGSEHTTLPA